MPDMYLDVDAGLSEVPVNLMPLIDDTDFKTVEDAVAYNASGMDLRWNFVTSAGAYTSTAVTPTTAGDYDWTHQGDGMYSIEIPASGGASINNDTEGYGWFSGRITGVLPFRGPVIGFRASGINDLLCDSAYSTTRGLAGTALPAAAADAAGGLPISDAGGLDLDAKIGALTYGTANRVNVQLYGCENNTITAAAIATGAIDADAIADNAIDAGAIASDAITAAKIADGAIDAATFAAGAINAAAIADGAIDRATFAADTGLQAVRSNTAQAGAGTTITLDASASATDDFYNNALIYLTGGTGAGQARFISDYVGSTKVATVPTWATNPDNTSMFAIIPFGSIPGATAPTAAEVADAVWDEATTSHTTSGTFGEQLKTDVDAILSAVSGTLNVNVTQISGDSGAADNAEAFFDGTGYAGTNNVIPTVTTTTTATNVTTVNGLAANVITATSIASDAITAAKIATGAIDADALATDAVTEIAAGISVPTANANADALLDRSNGIETSMTLRQAIRGLCAMLFGTNTGAGSGTEVFKNPAGDTTRVTHAVDSDGNRTPTTNL